MKVRRCSVLALLVLLAALGCRAAAPAPEPAVPPIPTSASVGGTSIVAIAPPAAACCPKQTLPQFLGITGLAHGLHDVCTRIRNRLGGIWPGLEAKPEVLALSDPANLESPNPAVAEAAAVKAEEDAAAQKAKAIAYLASVGCAGCYPGIEDALLAALDDCTEIVRFETAKALRSTTHLPCKNCCQSACCGERIREKLDKLAYETDALGCFVEPSDRVRRMARLALANCTCVPLKPVGEQQGLPLEGPGPEDVPPPAPAPEAVARSQGPVGSGVATAAARQAAQPASATNATVRPASYEDVLRAYHTASSAAPPPAVEVACEIYSAPRSRFSSRADALATMTLARTQLLSGPSGASAAIVPPQLERSARQWTDPARIASKPLAEAVALTPVGGVSGAVEDPSGWHLVRVLARRPLPQPTPAAVQPAAYVASPHPNSVLVPAQPAANGPVTVRLPPCDCP